LVQAAMRTILAGRADDTPFALQRPMVRRRADDFFLASHANGRLFYRPYIGVCQSTPAGNAARPYNFAGTAGYAPSAAEKNVEFFRNIQALCDN
jgi:hypothetical protein